MNGYELSDYSFCAHGFDKGDEYGAVLEFGPATDESDRHLKKVWGGMQNSLKSFHELTSTSGPTWTAWNPCGWAKETVPTRQRFVAWHEGILAGFVNLQANFDSQHFNGQKIMYIEHMCAFPGYLSSAIWDRRLRGMGVPFLAFSVFESFRQGFSGAVGFHVDPGAARFYDSLPEILGFDVFQSKMDNVDGPPPHLQRSRQQTYLETAPEAANKILEKCHA